MERKAKRRMLADMLINLKILELFSAAATDPAMRIFAISSRIYTSMEPPLELRYASIGDSIF